MSGFIFAGQIQASKSILNRNLILQSFDPSVTVLGESDAHDVKLMRKALEDFAKGEKQFQCGWAGTVLRFLALRVARQKGEYQLHGEPRLLSRPHQGLLKILWQLGVETDLKSDRLILKSYGWRPQGDGIHVSGEESSQFASALLLSAIGLEYPLFVALPERMVSRGFFELTKSALRHAGVVLESWGKDLRIPADQEIKVKELVSELDMGSAFAIAAAGALSGQVSISNFTWPSLQPDAAFVEILEKMQVPFSVKQNVFTIGIASRFEPLSMDLNSAPDLLPVAAVLCSFAKGESELRSVAHAAFKESNRLGKVEELLKLSGCPCRVENGTMKIGGQPERTRRSFGFSVDQDHRLAMAAGLFMLKGFDIQIDAPETVQKSFPGFWHIINPGLSRDLQCRL